MHTPKIASFLCVVIAFLIFCYPGSITAKTSNDNKADRKSDEFSLDISSSSIGDYMAASYASINDDIEYALKLYLNTLENNPNNPLLLQNAYKLALLSGDLKNAFALAKRMLVYNPESVSPQILLIVKAIKEGDFVHANSYLKELPYEKDTFLHNVGSVITPFLTIWVKLGMGEHEEAIKIAEKLAPLTKNSPIMANHTALIYDFLGNNEQAVKLYNKALSDKNNLERRFLKIAGNFYQRIHMLEKAQYIYKNYNEQHPDSYYFYSDLQLIKAAKTPEKLLGNIGSGVAKLLLEAIRILYKARFYQEALAYTHIVLYLESQNSDALIILANHHEQDERYINAIELYKAIKRHDNNYIDSRLGMARSWYKLKKYSSARKKFHSLIKEFSDNYLIFLTYADLLRNDEKFVEAADLYSKAIDKISATEQQQEQKHWSVYFARGICYERSGEWQKAEQDLLFALTLNPNQPDLLNYLGYSWIDRGINIKEAFTMIEKSLEARPNDAHIIDSMGWALYKLQNYEKAAYYLEKALEILPYDGVLNDHLGDIYWKQGRKLEARYQWKRALDHDLANLKEAELKHKMANGIN